jgi:hypothetical protein
LTDKNGVQVFVQDNLLIVGASSGGGGGGSVDPTTVLTTGDFKMQYGTGPIAGFVRCNGRTIGSATSGASERANADTSALFSFLWGNDPNLVVTGGRGASAAADFAANKPLALPDCRGRALAGLDDMGNSAAGNLTTIFFGSTPTTLGAIGGAQSSTLITSNLPPITPSGSVSTVLNGGLASFNVALGAGSTLYTTSGSPTPSNPTSTFTGTTGGGTSTAFANVPPTLLTTFYIKL